ncbi:MAG: glycoside hydrolase family 9 protein, partial [Bacteroidota bacterium]
NVYARPWGDFLRYSYYRFDFSDVKEPGIYTLAIGETETHPFQIHADIYDRHIWQPVLEYYLPVQMCHLRINEKYRVWHDRCHMDDALMAPVDTNHFDGYKQGPETLTPFKPYEKVPDLNQGGWHDAGDYDLRVESQIGTIWNLALMLEEFGIGDYDATTVDQTEGLVEIHQPDGISDMYQQIDHGLRSVLGGYRALGRLYRGIICHDLRQYVMLGDAASMTDNQWAETPGPGDDDRWVFTEENPGRELYVAAGLAAASRALKTYDETLASECIQVAKALYADAVKQAGNPVNRILALAELILATEDLAYGKELAQLEEDILSNFGRVSWAVGRVKDQLANEKLRHKLDKQAQARAQTLLANATTDSPYGVPYKPNIWGAGWNIQRFGVEQYYFHKSWPQLETESLFINAFNFIVGVHPGKNTASFASGIGSKSALVAYGVNRADWSYIPGGVASGTALIRPDLPEFKIWPFFWQQTEYVMGGGSTNFMFLALAMQKRFGT